MGEGPSKRKPFSWGLNIRSLMELELEAHQGLSSIFVRRTQAQTQLELDIQSQDRSRLNFLGLYLSLIRRQSSKYVDAFLLQLHCILNNMVINNGRLPIKVVVGSHNIIHRKMSHFDQILLCHTCYMLLFPQGRIFAVRHMFRIGSKKCIFYAKFDTFHDQINYIDGAISTMFEFVTDSV